LKFDRKPGPFILALIAALSLSAVSVRAQDMDALAATRPRRVTQQLVDAPRPTPTMVAVKQPEQAEQENVDNTNVVVPDQPKIVKRNANAISVPVDASKNELAYKEQPTSSSNIRIGSSFGYRRDPFTRRARFHSGLDIKAKWGDPVGASHPGTVQFAGWYHGYGNLIIIDHGGGVTTYYGHLSSFAVGAGDKVERGDVIGYAGSTGRATSPHLHYEVRIDGNPVNPLQEIAIDPSSDYFKDAAVKSTADDEAGSTPQSKR
jgi:murein DD-endopeptidase MepM/ murein hydrolase activator NlpD